MLSDKTPKRFVNTIGDGNGGKLSIEEVELKSPSLISQQILLLRKKKTRWPFGKFGFMYS